jgi:hypothetical protein
VIYPVLCILFIPPINPAIPSPSFLVCLKILFRVSPLHLFLIQFEFDMVGFQSFQIFPVCSFPPTNPGIHPLLVF